MTTFEALSARRRAYVEAARDNGFEKGLRKLLADLYPDNAHFIYELLQNAEDAGAREVIFDLQTAGLHVKHDGPLLFDLEDIGSITGIGQSTKADDATSIGKFGVGFKAVFAYTQTPVISSGEYSFAIHDLFIPAPVSADARDGWTTFWFPFDRADKPAERAVKEVAGALREISRTTLLFLNNIHLISCFLPDGDDRLLERRAFDENVVEIESLHEEEGPSYWYRIAGNVTVEGKEYPAAAAFALEPHASKQKEPNKPKGYAVKPVDGQVFIYFPAVKETSGLKFHVHAPFASTVARDSVRDDPGNDALVKGIAELVADALPRMREAGLITDGLLSALPNNNDDLPERYAVLRDQIASAFGTESLTPIAGGGHAPAHALLRSDRILRSALSVDDANFLRGLFTDVGDELAEGWLPVREGRAGAFLDSLAALGFARNELSEAFEHIGTAYDEIATSGDEPDYIDDEDRVDLASWGVWIAGKDDAWLRDFYIMLEGLVPKARTSNYFANLAADEFLTNLATAPLIRIQDGEGVRHVPGPDAHLPNAPDLRADGLVTDALAVFEGDDDSDGLELLHAFYRHAGVKRWDAAAQLDARFGTYSGQGAAITEQHLEDLNTLVRLIDDKAVSASTYSSRPILVAVRRDGTRYWAKPTGVYLDAPFASTGLASLYESNEYRDRARGRLDESYLDAAPEVAALAKALGAIHGLHVVPAVAKNNPQFVWAWVDRENHNKVSSDWCILYFDEIVSCANETLLRELWTLVASAPSMHADAVYKSNGSSGRHIMQSQLLQKLISKPWILDRDGNLRLPEDITAEELAEDLTVPTSAPLLERAGFGRRAVTNAQRLEADVEVAKKYGFESTEDMQWIAGLRKRDPDRFKAVLREMEAELRLPQAPSAAPERRAKRAEDLSADAPARRYDKRVRSVYVQVPGHLSAARSYLRQFYTNDDRIMVCQVCSCSMPFRISGEFYFEAVQFVKDSKRDLRENRLALCPTCAAKYRHARGTSLQDLRDDLLTQSVGYQSSVTVNVLLAEEPATVRFVGKHAIDLQAALLATEGEPIEDDDFSLANDTEQ